jgi:hypothetical protein
MLHSKRVADVSFTPLMWLRLPSGQIKHLALFVNQMSQKAWCLRHGFRRLKIRNCRETPTGVGDLDIGFGWLVSGNNKPRVSCLSDRPKHASRELNDSDARDRRKAQRARI